MLNAYEAPVADVYTPGAHAVTLPGVARSVVCIGEGSVAAVSNGATPTALETIGIEQDTALLVIGRRTFAAHGCVVTAEGLNRKQPALLDTVPGSFVLRRSPALSVLFPAVGAGWTLSIVIAPRSPQPGALADQIRWAAVDATLGPLRAVISTRRVALLMALTATGPWTLKVEVGPDWGLIGISLTDLDVAGLAAQFDSDARWDLVDDRFEPPAAGISAGLNLEVTS